MKTISNPLQFDFDRFLLAVYPDPPQPSSDQYRQLLDAWMAGALAALNNMSVDDLAAVEVLREVDAYGKAAKARVLA